MIFCKNRIFRYFSFVKFSTKIQPALEKEKSSKVWNKKETVPISISSIWKICSMKSKNEIEDYAENSLKLFKENETNQLSDRFLELSLLYLKTFHGVYLQEIKNLEPKIQKKCLELHGSKEIGDRKNLMKITYGLELLTKIKNGIAISYSSLIIFEKMTKLLDLNFTPEDKENIEIFYLILGMSYITNLSFSNKDPEIVIYPILQSNLESLNLCKTYKTLLLKTIKDSENKNYKDLLDPKFLMHLYSQILKKTTPQQQEEFLDFLWEVRFLSKFSFEFSQKLFLDVLEESIFKKNEFSNKFSMFGITLIKNLTKNLEKTDNYYFSKIFFLISKENMMKFNYIALENFWEKFTSAFTERYNCGTVIYQKNILYSLGKEAFLTEEIKNKVFIQELNTFKLLNCKDMKLLVIDKYINIIKAGLNLKIYSQYEFDQFIKSFEEKLDKSPEKLEKIWFDLAPLAIRINYLSYNFWNRYFEVLKKKITDDSQKFFHVFFVLKVMNFIFQGTFHTEINNSEENDMNIQDKNKELYDLFKEIMKIPKVEKLYNKTLISYYLAELENNGKKKISDKNSLVETIMAKCLNSLGIPFVPERQIEFMIVDFYLPIENIVVEVLGPGHLIKGEVNGQIMTLLTEFKIKCLKELGFRLIIIHHKQETQKDGCSLERNFLKQYNELINQKKELI